MTPGSVVVVGGCGRVGLPLGLALADAGRDVTLYDINTAAIELVGGGTMPFLENGADEVLERVLEAGRLHLSADPESVEAGRARDHRRGHAGRRAPQPRTPVTSCGPSS